MGYFIKNIKKNLERFVDTVKRSLSTIKFNDAKEIN